MAQVTSPILCSIMSCQETLEPLWLHAPEGKLCGREQAQTWALREVWRSEGKSEYGMLTFVASKLVKNKKGKPSPKDKPTVASVKEFFDKIDGDTDWFPSKHNDAKKGSQACVERWQGGCHRVGMQEAQS